MYNFLRVPNAWFSCFCYWSCSFADFTPPFCKIYNQQSVILAGKLGCVYARGEIAVDCRRLVWRTRKKHLNGESSVDFIFVLLSPSLQQLATAKFGKFACSLAFVALSSNSTSCRCMSRQQPMFVLTYHHSSTSTRQGRCLLKGRRRLQTCLLAATGFLCFAPLL